ncbi:hypothetical protein NliqN6_3410 [Naganishia liquefaciens]|uniref:C2H2-type domain-containing protein n=1 Tax=Naganishia liquefaciens TaxID=104408 RepID=A0A8H3YF78_9TREE|nr:hypothetical protein NliqN6_3410 [Naganishia liquefaciens]
MQYHRVVRTHACPFCKKSHVSLSTVVAHLEAGKCTSGANRQLVDQFIWRSTRGANATAGALVKRSNNAPTLEPLMAYQATELSRNMYGRYECYFCPGLDFPYLAQLNQHLASPKHSKRPTSGLYTCPQCSKATETFSGLIQHAEMGKCGIRKNLAVQNALDTLTTKMNQLC